MSQRYRISPAANRDLDELADFLACEAGLETALHFYDAAAATFEMVARMPGIGEPRVSQESRLSEVRVCSISGFEWMRLGVGNASFIPHKPPLPLTSGTLLRA